MLNKQRANVLGLNVLCQADELQGEKEGELMDISGGTCMGGTTGGKRQREVGIFGEPGSKKKKTGTPFRWLSWSLTSVCQSVCPTINPLALPPPHHFSVHK